MTRYLLYTETYPSASPDSPRQTGIGNYCSDLAAGLAGMGHAVTVLTAGDGSDGGGKAGHGRPTVERVGAAPRRAADLLARAAMLRRRLAASEPHYLLVGDPTAHKVVALAGLAEGVRYCPMFYGTELRGYADLFARRGWSPMPRLARHLLARYIGRAHQPISISRYTAGCLASLGLPPRPECIVFPSVSAPFLTRPVRPAAVAALRARRPAGGAADPIRYLTVARISERKNQLQVLEVLAALHRRHGLAFQYVIVGNVDSSAHTAYFDSIQRFTREHRLEDSVLVVPHASDDEKIDWIDASDVFVMLSRAVGHSVEGFGISVIEASCRGKPVVVSDQGGMPETIVEGQTGFSVALDSTDAVAAPLLELARRPELRRTLGANGARFVRENFTPRHMAERLTDHLERRAPVCPPRGPNLSSRSSATLTPTRQ